MTEIELSITISGMKREALFRVQSICSDMVRIWLLDIAFNISVCYPLPLVLWLCAYSALAAVLVVKTCFDR